MIVIPPVDIYSDTVKLISSSLTDGTETDPSLWSVATAYSLGDRVYLPASGSTPSKIYEALVAVTGGSEPSIDVVAVTPKWIEVSSTNKWAMFDLMRETVSTSTTTNITVVIAPGERTDSIALLNMTGVTELKVTGTDPEGTTLYPTVTIANPSSSHVLTDLPLSVYLRITIELNGDTLMTVGSIAVGTARYIGTVQRGINLGALNFSEVTRDIYGNASLIPRRNVPKVSKKLFALAEYVSSIIETRDLLNAVPAVWVGMENNDIPDYYESLLIVGFYRTFTITLDSHLSATISLELEEI